MQGLSDGLTHVSKIEVSHRESKEDTKKVLNHDETVRSIDSNEELIVIQPVPKKHKLSENVSIDDSPPNESNRKRI
jgi:hypothetical protein